MNGQPRRVNRRGRLAQDSEPPTPSPDIESTPPERVRRGAPIVSGDVTAPRRRPIWQIIIRNGLGIASAVVILWILFGSGWFNVRGIEMKGNTTLSQADVEDRVQQYFNSHPLERNVFFTKTEAIADLLQDNYPTVKKLNINRTLFLKLQIRVTESNPALLWQTGGERWVVAEDGRILRPAGDQTIQGTIVDMAQLEVKVGDRVGDAQFISFVRDVYAKSGDYQFTLQATSIEDTTRELKALLDSGIAIRMDSTRSAAEQLRAARVSFDTASRDRIPVKEYVDVRVPGRAFYR